MFLKSITNIGYPDSTKLKKDIEQLNKNPKISKFLEELSTHLHPDNVVTQDQQLAYKNLQDSCQVLNANELLEARRHEELQKKMLLEKQQSLQHELVSAKKRLSLLHQQLQVLDKTKEESIASEDNLQDVSRHSAILLNKSREKRKIAFNQYLQKVSQVRCDCESMSSCYKTQNKDSLLSHINLGRYFSNEDTYTAQLTEHAKKQFRGVAVTAGDLTDLSSKLYTAADTVIIGDGDHNVKQELLNDLKRATLGYASRKKRSILANANLEKSMAINSFLKQRKAAVKYRNCGSTESLKSSTENIRDQCSYILQSALPVLLSKGEPKLKNLFLTGDFKRKLKEQREIRSKQNEMIELLLQQCSRLSVVWMLLRTERIQSDVLAQLIFSLQVLLSADLKTIRDDTQVFNAAASVDHSNKDPKAVIDKRDQVMVHLHDLLVEEPSSGSMFKTFESIREAVEKLKESKSLSNSLNHNVHQRLRECLETLHSRYYDGNLNDGSVLLSDPRTSLRSENLQSAVADAKVSVSKLLSNVDKKRAFIGHNEAASLNRQIWIDFVTNALEKD